MQQACKIIKEIPQETILGLLKNPLARHAIAKKVIKLVKKGTISLELVLASKSKLKQVTKQASKQQTKASGSVWKQLSFSSPAIEMRLDCSCLFSIDAAAFTYISMNGEEAQNGSVLRNALDLTNPFSFGL